MPNRSSLISITLLPLLLGSYSTVSALDLTSDTFYVGGGIGASWLDPDTSNTVYSISDDVDFAWHLLGGYRINENFAVELAYTDLGKADIAAGGAPVGEISYRQTTLGLLWFPTIRPDLTWQPRLSLPTR